MLTLLLACSTPSAPSDVQDNDFNPVRDTAFYDSGEADADTDTDTDTDTDADADADTDTDTDADTDVSTIADYDFSDGRSLLYVQVYKDPDAWASDLAHNHVMTASNWSGEATWDTSDLSACAFSFQLDVEDLIVDDTDMRAYVGYGDAISNSDRSAIRDHMLASNQLNASAHPRITFESSSCSGTLAKPKVKGTLKLAGGSRQVEIPMNLKINQNGKLKADGSFTIKATDFGFDPYEAYGGAVRNLNKMDISFELLSK